MADPVRHLSIPLRCRICPKRPKFSDLSHLLTHVASKGHLAQQFKATVRASTDEAASDALQAYNEWYQKYGIEELCANRLRTNEGKKAKNKGTLQSTVQPIVTRSSALSSSEPGPSRYLNAVDDTVGRPQLEPSLAMNLADIHAAHHRTQVPRMHLWSTDADRRHDAPKPVPELDSYPVFPYYDSAGAQSSYIAESDRYIPVHPLGYPLESPMQMHSGFPLDADYSDGISDEIEKAEGESQLKGVFWPGMNIFDSAPPEMRRKRNQRKDGSVVAQMQLNSALVEPTELVFWADGDLKKERRIYAPAELCPIESGQTTKKTRSSRALKPALTETSVNIPRLKRPICVGKAGDEVDFTKTDLVARPSTQLAGLTKVQPAPLSYHDRKRSRASTPESTMVSGSHENYKIRKRSLHVFRDPQEMEHENQHRATSLFSDTGHLPGCLGGVPARNAGDSQSVSPTVDEFDADPLQKQITSFFRPIHSYQSALRHEELRSHCSEGGDGTMRRARSEGRTERYPSEDGPSSTPFLDSLRLEDFGAYRSPPTFGYSTNPLATNSKTIHGHGLSMGCGTASATGLQRLPSYSIGLRSFPLGLPPKTEPGHEFNSEMLFHQVQS